MIQALTLHRDWHENEEYSHRESGSLAVYVVPEKAPLNRYSAHDFALDLSGYRHSFHTYIIFTAKHFEGTKLRQKLLSIARHAISSADIGSHGFIVEILWAQ